MSLSTEASIDHMKQMLRCFLLKNEKYYSTFGIPKKGDRPFSVS